MKVFKHKHFSRWAKSERLTNKSILKAIQEMQNGLFGVNLGGGLYKKRIAKPGRGKSSGFRTLVVFKQDVRAIFVYGFSKNEKDNIDERERSVYKFLADKYLTLNEDHESKLIENGELIEVDYD